VVHASAIRASPVFRPRRHLFLCASEINIMGRQSLNRRLHNRSSMAREIAAWESIPNAKVARFHWTFNPAVARQRLRKLYPSFED
jgi:hypothetical protein